MALRFEAVSTDHLRKHLRFLSLSLYLCSS
ncbi:hypothetical protein AMTRI_Chr07g80460 [Amborella trichopoda]